MTVCDLFAGIGGFSLGLERAGMTIKHQVEIDGFCQRVLAKHWPNVTRSTDIRQVKPEEIGPVDVVCGGYPCQPFSHAGKRQGQDDDRHLWPEAYRLLVALRPTWALFENVAGHVTMGLDDVLSDLERAGYACWPLIIPACAVNAPHRRDRVWIIGHTESGNARRAEIRPGSERQGGERVWRKLFNESCRTSGHAPDTCREGLPKWERCLPIREGKNSRTEFVRENGSPWNEPWLEAATRLCAVDDGIPGGLVRPRGWRVNALKAAGNSVVPQVVEQIGRAIMEASK